MSRLYYLFRFILVTSYSVVITMCLSLIYCAIQNPNRNILFVIIVLISLSIGIIDVVYTIANDFNQKTVDEIDELLIKQKNSIVIEMNKNHNSILVEINSMRCKPEVNDLQESNSTSSSIRLKFSDDCCGCDDDNCC